VHTENLVLIEFFDVIVCLLKLVYVWLHNNLTDVNTDTRVEALSGVNFEGDGAQNWAQSQRARGRQLAH
jgi:hypothetical protein